MHLKNAHYLERFRHELRELGYAFHITLPVSFLLRRRSALAVSPESRFLVVAADTLFMPLSRFTVSRCGFAVLVRR